MGKNQVAGLGLRSLANLLRSFARLPLRSAIDVPVYRYWHRVWTPKAAEETLTDETHEEQNRTEKGMKEEGGYC